MRNKKRIFSAIVLMAVYAFFFASTNLFYHSHYIADIKIVHSHPWSGSSHSHDNGQLTLISILDAEAFQDAESIAAPDSADSFLVILEENRFVAAVPSASVLSFSLRAPPAGC